MSETLPRAFGAPVLTARFRSTPEDFFVEELPGFEPSGEGEHLLLTIEKRGMNTAFAAKRIASWAGIAEMGVGYAGLKDRHAVTRQRFSVHLPRKVAPDLAGLVSDDLKVVDASWHARKLPRGALAGNRFELVLREVAGERDAIDARLGEIATLGLPNWFGEQRFGRDGGNVAAALAMFAGRRVRRDQRSILLSAARSELFNRVLAARLADSSWNRGLDGEVWMLAGSRSVFGPEPWSEALAQRLAEFDIHPTGPLWGQGESRAHAAARACEDAAMFADDALALKAGLEREGLRHERRALRLRPEGLAWDWIGPDALRLAFALPPGSYATGVLHELGDVAEASRP
ncbi:MAG: tRNA pseudouridine(13) synthase TruD [Pseudoxanthomonas sp.]